MGRKDEDKFGRGGEKGRGRRNILLYRFVQEKFESFGELVIAAAHNGRTARVVTAPDGRRVQDVGHRLAAAKGDFLQMVAVRLCQLAQRLGIAGGKGQKVGRLIGDRHGFGRRRVRQNEMGIGARPAKGADPGMTGPLAYWPGLRFDRYGERGVIQKDVRV